MVRVQALGHFEVETNGERLTALAAQPLRGSLLLYLCVEREATREALVRLFWPDREEDKARRLLSQALYELKRLLGAEWFVAAGEVVRTVNVAVDVHALDTALARNELDRALALYQGRFLANFDRFDSGEFNTWVDRKAAQYERLHRRARRERIKQHLDEGDRLAALGVAQHWCDLDPLEDEAQHRTIELLHELGRRVEALLTYESYRARLKEIELQPLEETRALAAQVREHDTVQLPAAPVRVQPVVGKTPSAKPWYRRRADVLAGVAIVSALLLLPVLALNRENEVRTAAIPRDSAGSDLSRVAVLYFEVSPPSPELDYLAKGLTEALIDELGRVDELSVISRHGVKPYQGTEVSIDSIRRALRVGTVVEGSIQKTGNVLRARVNLVDASTSERVESRTLERPVGASFQLEDDAMREVGIFLRNRLGREINLRRIAHGTSNEEAYRLYQTADGYRDQVLSMYSNVRPSELRKYDFLLRTADSLLIEAERLDREWQEPALLRGWLAYHRGGFTSAPRSQRSNTYLRSAVRIAGRILENEPRNAGAFELRGTALRVLANNAVETAAGDSLSRRAIDDLETAVRIDGRRAAAWNVLSQLKQLAGEVEEAAMYARRALEVDAFLHETPDIINRLYRVEMDRGLFTESEQLCRTGARDYSQDYRFTECFLLLAATNPAGRIPMDSAFTLLNRLNLLDPPESDATWDYKVIFREMLKARMWARNERPDSARAVLARARRVVQEDSVLSPSFGFDAAHVLLLSGDTTAAIKELKQFIAVNPRYRNYVLQGVAFRGIQHLLLGIH